MSDRSIVEQPLVFGLDIGTRNVVGTVGYRTEEEEFIVVAQYMTEHQTRAMLDGQIHDIGRVAKTIKRVKEELESQIGQPLSEVCIAAAGRVLKTVTTHISYDFAEETIVDGEDIHTLNLLGIERAQDILKEKNDTRYKFYCVGYSVVKYYLNDDVFSNLEAHKADRIGEDVIVTFLPEDVVDGLYAAVEQAGLVVANMTLEPIAAINVAIPENFRLLNIALVDIGAGTSDISVTRDGSIVAYGMIPLAGDEITELIVQNYLVDFNTAEMIKLASGVTGEITYKDIMLIEHTVTAEEIWNLSAPVVDRMTGEVAAKIRELNGDKSVSAAFIVGGGGKIHGYTEMLAEKLDLPPERVALRGEEVLQEVTFRQEDIKKDPLLVTPIGICLNYYDQRNNFIMVRFNGERVKLYDNNKLTIVDVALQAGFPNEELFPKRGRALQFLVNGVPRIVRGEAGESAQIYMNGRPANINTPLEPNGEIYIEPSTMGGPAALRLEQLEEYTTSDVTFVVNDRIVRCPKFLEVNGSLEPPFYEIREGDRIDTRSFYTVGQLVEFMDVELDQDREIFVNNRLADLDTLIYENFSIEWTVLSFGVAEEPAGTAASERQKRSEEEETKQPAVLSAGDPEEMREAGTERRSLPGERDLPEESRYGELPGRSLPGERDLPEESRYDDRPGRNLPVMDSVDKTEGGMLKEQETSGERAASAEAEGAGDRGTSVKEEEAGNHDTFVRQETFWERDASASEVEEEGRDRSGAKGQKPIAEQELPGREKTDASAAYAREVSSDRGVPVREPLPDREMPAREALSDRGVPVREPLPDREMPAREASSDRGVPVREPLPDREMPAREVSLDRGVPVREPLPDREMSARETFGERDASAAAEQQQPLPQRHFGQLPRFTPMKKPGQPSASSAVSEEASATTEVTILVNGERVCLTGKKSYIFVDLFDFYDFDLKASAGRGIITKLNGKNAHFSALLTNGDQIELRWQ